MSRTSRPAAAPATYALAALILTLAAPATAQETPATALTPATAPIPSPEDFFGHQMGADRQLAHWPQLVEYYELIDAASDRVHVVHMGPSTLGEPFLSIFVSSPENLARLDDFRRMNAVLQDPRGHTEDEIDDAIVNGKVVFVQSYALHSTEVAGSQSPAEIMYLFATRDDDEIHEILDNTISILIPAFNPDGVGIVNEWYDRWVGTEYEGASPPELYHHYIGHDNNRDGYMINQIESRMATRVAREWEPHILYNHHQSSPFPTRIWIPPFAEPISPHVHPLMWRTVNLIGMAMSQALEERGQKGATHMGTGFDNWYPGFMDHANNFHNVASFLTETGLYRYATPGFYTIQDFPPRTRELRPESLYSSPWEGGWWRLRDAVDYMLTASISVLDFAAKYRRDLLYNRYQAGRDIIAQYTDGPPYAYFVPQEQRDPVAAVEMLRRLAYNGIEVHQLSAAVTHDGIAHPTGTWVIAMDQPFANFVRQLFAVQEYPDLRQYPEGPPDQPYDVSGWTLPYMMDVRVIEAASPLGEDVRGAMSRLGAAGGEAEAAGASMLAWDADVADASPFDSPPGVGFDSNPVAAAIVPPGGSDGGGNALRLDPAQNNAFKALNRAWAIGGQAGFVAGTAGEDGAPGTSGHYVVTGLSGSERRELVGELRLRAERAGGAGTSLARPRVALYRPWNASIDEGWTRWLLEMYDFGFTSLYNADVLAGGLRDRYDVIVIADMGAGQIMNGFAKGSVPPRYEGGIGARGVRELDAFVRGGGTLVTLNNASMFAINQLHLPVRNVTAELASNEYFMSGSIVEMEVDPSHPVMSGMTARAKVVVERSPVFTTEEGFEGAVLAKYPQEGSPLLSGYLLGEEHLQGYAAALDVAHGDGRVVLLGMKPQWRGQPFGNFRVLFNAALYGAELAAVTPPNPDFWEAPEEEEGEGEGEEGNRGPRQ